MTRKQKRLTVIGAGLATLGAAAALVLFALRQEIVFFRTPSDLVEQPVAAGTRLRIGGLVEAGSVKRDSGTQVEFAVTDTIKSLNVTYVGILPDLFREGQGVVAEGCCLPMASLRQIRFLAKHDENYMPKEVADSLKEKGVWQGDMKAAP